ncbi:MAG: NADH-quinone oxidoreductase subunit I [Desulfobulbaceae bacterium S3730MH12]|nr:MAG: NADH-quinone oxidoreductase subunit I [Desulfobulbaceae bacterium S5133MH15]OEU58608.1 MAG: NADH-quinone oxidoreductase subunit I [Desulfobulbaceae bacterium S3730MH12]OEU84579.1 MAG: NADH-quinone oxidoreductase subunit I [Desulfobulbaceae bacterium C00003063]
MVTYFKDIYSGLVSLFIGMEVTFKEFFKPTVTVQYPYETLTMTERYRGHVELIENDEGKPNCIVCGLCQRACPSACITLAGVKPEGEKKKVLTKYILDFTRCSLCGSCVESCNFNALEFSKEYNLASTRREDFIFDLLQRLEDRNK